jgi:hypothetical protein
MLIRIVAVVVPVNKKEPSSVSGLIKGIASSVLPVCDDCLFRRNVVVLLSGGISGRLFRKFSVRGVDRSACSGEEPDVVQMICNVRW